MKLFDRIRKPTLLLDEVKALRNIHWMAEKVRQQGIRFRPHFKTHQSQEIGTWFHQDGVDAITVSSVDMADYFARAIPPGLTGEGQRWSDITIAFPFNWRQLRDIQRIAAGLAPAAARLGLVVESVETVNFLTRYLDSTGVDIWIKIDAGYHRTGMAWDNPAPVADVIEAIGSGGPLRLRGLLTHAGQTFTASSPADVCDKYQTSVGRMNYLRDALTQRGVTSLQVSVGDTPGCTLCADLGQVDEVRPGNFVLYDTMQLHLGVCSADQIAAALACPVVAKHPERNEVVIHGGAIHLSKDYFMQDGEKVYGHVAFATETGWGEPVAGAYVSALSQEHGVVRFTGAGFEQAALGDLLFILPAHSCLAVTAMKEYLTLTGKVISTMNSNP
jgi:D-serine deaminase-like pyridoxal phosphate-dependent protein